MTKLKETPSQTAGPFVHIGTLPHAAGLRANMHAQNRLVGGDTPGRRIQISGVIHDGAGELVKDALVEIWQADGDGRYGGKGFLGWGRAATDFSTGLFVFETIKPGATLFHDGRKQAPHVTFAIFARGINVHLQTRMYFPDEAVANATDPILQLLGKVELTETLIAQKDDDHSYRFDIRLQGEGETVFFDF
jgi:protocatechuate 3,4-dioxygenase, alpha subunit